MRRKTFAKLLGTAASAAILLSSMGIAAVPVSAASEEELRQAAKAYVDANKNAVTPEGLLAAVQAVCPGATLDTENDFFIKHAVPGVTDDDPEYPLNIPGSDGAVAAVFESALQRLSPTSRRLSRSRKSLWWARARALPMRRIRIPVVHPAMWIM